MIKGKTKKTNLNSVSENKVKKTTGNTVKKAPKSAVKKTAPKDEFRKNKDTGHPSYIYQKVGRKYVYIGITHSSITNNVKNIKLEKNPNPNDKKEAYFRPKAGEASSNRFKKKEQGWRLSKEDKKKADIIAKKTSTKK